MPRTTKTTKQTAAEAYAARHAECADLLKRIGQRLDAHQAEQTTEPRNWCYVGDLDYIAQQLAYVLAHLGDRSAVDLKGLEY